MTDSTDFELLGFELMMIDKTKLRFRCRVEYRDCWNRNNAVFSMMSKQIPPHRRCWKMILPQTVRSRFFRFFMLCRLITSPFFLKKKQKQKSNITLSKKHFISRPLPTRREEFIRLRQTLETFEVQRTRWSKNKKPNMWPIRMHQTTRIAFHGLARRVSGIERFK